MCSMEKTLLNITKWKGEHKENIEGLSEFLVSEVFLSYENVKKDNITLLALDLPLISSFLKKINRKEDSLETKEVLIQRNSFLLRDPFKKT